VKVLGPSMYSSLFLVASLLLVTVGRCQAKDCLNGWVGYGDKCYFFSKTKKNLDWWGAHNLCRGEKSQLASIGSPTIQDFINHNIKDSKVDTVYIGGLDISGWQWLDGTPWGKTEKGQMWSNWAPGQPLRDETCLKMRHQTSGKWYSQNCNSKENVAYVCSYNIELNNGVVTSPNFPYNYGNNEDITTTIELAKDKLIFIEFIYFHLEAASDYLKIEEGNGAILLTETSGQNLPQSFTSKTNKVVIKFHSDYSATYQGFQLIWHEK